MNLWLHEVHQRALGLTVDPYLAQFGRGGAMPGYNEKLIVVDRIREEYQRSHSKIRSLPIHRRCATSYERTLASADF
jgi:hypothetical protein